MLTSTMKNDLISGLLTLFPDNITAIILYGSVARNEATPESDVDIAIIIKKEMDDDIKNKFINWAADLDLRYDRIFSIIDIKEENLQKMGKSASILSKRAKGRNCPLEGSLNELVLYRIKNPKFQLTLFFM